MGVNIVKVGDEVKLSLADDTVSENNLLAGATAHNAAGEPITGAVVVAPIDSELSEISENAIQNKVVTAALNNKADKSEIPTSLPANGGKADTISEWGTRVIPDLNNAELGFTAAAGEVGHLNSPNSFWSTVLTTGSNTAEAFRTQFAFPWSSYSQSQRLKYRVKDTNVWSEWWEVFTSVNKPFIVGMGIVPNGSATCTTNHGFTPSLVLWWGVNSYEVSVALSFDTVSFNVDTVMNTIPSTDRLINYIIFK